MKTVLITGATSGPGHYLAKRLSDHKLLLHGCSPTRTKRLAEELGAQPYVADLGDLSQVRRFAAEVSADHSNIDTDTILEKP